MKKNFKVRCAKVCLILLLSHAPVCKVMCQSVDNGTSCALEKQDTCEKNVVYYLELGRKLKFGIGVQQDFEAAFKAFTNGVYNNSIDCLYELGMMYFVGMGCEQNYDMALQCFQQGMERRHRPSSLMFAKCYKYGLGVNKDSKIANEILTSLSNEGYVRASKELSLENNNDDALSFDVNRFQTLLNTPNVGVYNICGTYIGDAVIMDYSKKRVLDIIPIKITINSENNKVHGMLHFGEENIPFCASAVKENNFMFDETSVEFNSRLTDGLIRYRFDSANVYSDNDELCADITTKVWQTNETGLPVCLNVRKISGNTTMINSTSSDMELSAEWISPKQIKIEYNLPSNSDEMSVRIFNMSGMELSSYRYNKLNAGKGTLTVNCNAKDQSIIILVETKDVKSSVTLMR